MPRMPGGVGMRGCQRQGFRDSEVEDMVEIVTVASLGRAMPVAGSISLLSFGTFPLGVGALRYYPANLRGSARPEIFLARRLENTLRRTENQSLSEFCPSMKDQSTHQAGDR
jgi:hypothetical protein